ncbi:hypothetical protein MSAN_00461600 [Mycena sanguinolenta]|uniref:DUF6534 domain-containing protein n=1 Tax=Mycena sanguinolenta TaxID=230812 RepID=A0A8H6ZF41_9AGAR|nr:hypothetical protein MSAN_00461600 [Mycena sanguinolenta]
MHKALPKLSGFGTFSGGPGFPPPGQSTLNTHVLPLIDVGETFGALLVGSLISYVLLGAVMMQVYVYYGRFPNDSLIVKIMVGVAWCAELANGIGLAVSLYTLIITNFGHPERLVFSPRLYWSLPLWELWVQGFFAFRIYILSKSLWIPCHCWALSLFRLIPAYVIVLGFGTREPVAEFLERWGTLFNAIWAASAANDLLIAGTLVFLLYRQRSGALNRTAAIVDRMIEWTIETGMITSIIMLSFFIAMPDNFMWLAFFASFPTRSWLELSEGDQSSEYFVEMTRMTYDEETVKM